MNKVIKKFCSSDYLSNQIIQLIGDVFMIIIGLILAYYLKIYLV